MKVVDDDSSSSLGGIRPILGARTAEQRIEAALRQEIVDGVLRPGVRLPYREIADAYDVSITPVRMALHVLATDGFVVLESNKGARVRLLSGEDVQAVYAARIGVESLLARLGAKHITDAGLQAMDEVLGRLEASSHEDPATFMAEVWRYRLPCYEAARRPDLMTEVSILMDRSRPYNELAVLGPDRHDEALGFHRVFRTACQNRDGVAAQNIVREAIDWSLWYLLDHFVERHGRESPPAGPWQRSVPHDGRTRGGHG